MNILLQKYVDLILNMNVPSRFLFLIRDDGEMPSML